MVLMVVFLPAGLLTTGTLKVAALAVATSFAACIQSFRLKVPTKLAQAGLILYVIGLVLGTIGLFAFIAMIG